MELVQELHGREALSYSEQKKAAAVLVPIIDVDSKLSILFTLRSAESPLMLMKFPFLVDMQKKNLMGHA